jgi:soluble lytic murein transglycosylase
MAGLCRERLDDPEYNVRLGTTYLAQVLDMFDGTEELALAGYNGGPYRMKRLWREAQERGGGDRAEMDYFIESLPVPESRDYAKRVLLFAGNYRDLYGL